VVSDEVEIQIPDKMFFRIGELAELVGVEPHVLRYWEQEFRVRPQRSPSGQRMYRRKDISKFLKIKQLLYKQGFTIAGARRALADSDGPSDAPMDSDLDSLRGVADRLAALRDRIGAVKERIERDWDRHLGKSG
jgi:DNA-binding transcriptional MerR regulator